MLPDFHTKIHFLPLILCQLRRVLITSIKDFREIVLLFLLIWKRHSDSILEIIPSELRERRSRMCFRTRWDSGHGSCFVLVYLQPVAQTPRKRL